MDVGNSDKWAKAPPCTWSAIPPPELRGEAFEDLSTNGGFFSFGKLLSSINYPINYLHTSHKLMTLRACLDMDQKALIGDYLLEKNTRETPISAR